MVRIVNLISVKLFNSLVVINNSNVSNFDINTLYEVLNVKYPDSTDLNKTLISDIDSVFGDDEYAINDTKQFLAYLYPEEYSVVINDRVNTNPVKKQNNVMSVIDIDTFNNNLMSFISGNYGVDNTTAHLIVTYLVNYKDNVHTSDIGIKIVKYGYMLESSILPEDPDEFLVLLVYITTRVPMLVKDKNTLNSMYNNADTLALLIIQYCDIVDDGVNKLASVFYRNKSVFMSIKIGISPNLKDVRHLINLIRRKASKFHKPIKEAVYKRVLSEHLKQTELMKVLLGLDTPYLIKIMSGASYRIEALNRGYNIAKYRIRNGNSMIDTFSSNLDINDYANIYINIKDIIHNRIVSNIDKYNIVFENSLNIDIDLGIPVNAKQMVGNLPYGTVINYENSDDVMFGIYWTEENMNYTSSVDLDLSLVTSDSKIGWNGDRINSDKTMAYSGDVTVAPKGASEVIYIKKTIPYTMYEINVNNFSRTEDVDFVFSIANTPINMDKFNTKYFMNVDDVQYSLPLKFYAKITGMKIGNLYNNGNSTSLIINSSGNLSNVSNIINEDEQIVSMCEMLSKPVLSDVVNISQYTPKHTDNEVVIDVSNPSINNLMLLIK